MVLVIKFKALAKLAVLAKTLFRQAHQTHIQLNVHIIFNNAQYLQKYRFAVIADHLKKHLQLLIMRSEAAHVENSYHTIKNIKKALEENEDFIPRFIL
jgi:hypothetical protein